MATINIAGGNNFGSEADDVFVLAEAIEENFSLFGKGGHDKWIADISLFKGSFSTNSIEEIVLAGEFSQTLSFGTGAIKIDASQTKSAVKITVSAPDLVLLGGDFTMVRVDPGLSSLSTVQFDIASGAASGMVSAATAGASVTGTYTNISGVISYDTNDTIYGADGYQFAELGSGTNFFDGREGTDRAIYNGSSNQFSATIEKSGKVIVHDRRLPDGDVDVLVNVEQVYFRDDEKPLTDISILTGVVNVSSADLSAFIEMYIAYFNRAPDAQGLFYWGTRLSAGMSKNEIAESFYVQPETQALYTNPADTKGFVTAVYQNFLGRAPDTDGFNYWVKQLDDGIVSKPIFLLVIINGAKAASGSQTDVDYFTNKANIGAYYSVIKGMSNTDNAKAAMALYNGSAASITAAKNAIDGFYTAALDANSGELLINLVGVMDDPFAV